MRSHPLDGKSAAARSTSAKLDDLLTSSPDPMKKHRLLPRWIGRDILHRITMLRSYVPVRLTFNHMSYVYMLTRASAFPRQFLYVSGRDPDVTESVVEYYVKHL